MIMVRLIKRLCMKLFNEFKMAFNEGFLISNNILGLDEIEDMLYKNRANLFRVKNSFYLIIDSSNFIIYFVNDILNLNLPNKFINIIFKIKLNEYEKEFLSLNRFEIFDTYTQMILKNKNLEHKKFDNILLANICDIEKIYQFFFKYFSSTFITKFQLQDKIINNFVFIIKNKNKIIGGLIYSTYLNSAYLDFIAVDENVRKTGLASTLIKYFFSLDADYFRLFVSNYNINAIKFYKKFGFNFNSIESIFLKKREDK